MATFSELLDDASVVDTLIRDENPIGAPWARMDPGITAGRVRTTFGGGYSAVTASGTGPDAGYYSTASYSAASQYIFAKVTFTRFGSVSGRHHGLWVCRPTASTVTDQDGYFAKMELTATSEKYKFKLERYTNGTGTVLAEFESAAGEYKPVNGSRMAIVVGGGKVRLFLSTGEATEFVEKLSAEDSTYTAGYSGLWAHGPGEPQVKNFATGEFVLEEPFREALDELPITDNLTRLESTLAGDWKLLKPGVLTGEATTAGGGGWRAKTAFVTGPDGAYWSKEQFSASGGDHIAAVIKLSQVATTNDRSTGVWICRDGTTPETAESGYYLRAEFKGSGKIKFKLEKWVTGTPSTMAELETTEYAAGSRIAIVVGGGAVSFWASKGAETVFRERLSVSDSTYTSGYAGLMAQGTGEFIVRDFAAGVFFEEEGEPEPPEATTGVASSVTSTGATLNGTVDPNGEATDYYFEYGKTESYGTKIPVTEDGEAGEGTTPVAVDEVVTGLDPNTTYHFRLVAVNAKGTDNGSDQTFKTAEEAKAPEVVTGEADDITEDSATLNGTVDPNLALTDYYFEYGKTVGYGTKVPVGEDGEAGAGNSPVAVDEPISGLEPGTTYHFRLVGKNAKGEDVGEDEEFTTDEEEGKTVKVKVGGTVVDAKRWVMVGGELVSI